MASDPSCADSLDRFLVAQRNSYGRALAELRAGRKRTHWMWFVLPQLRGLGLSEDSWFYGIASLDEACRYLAHPVLGARLRECVGAIDLHAGQAIQSVLGDVDAMKYRSCLTLFAVADGRAGLFKEALATFFQGQEDERTLQWLANDRPSPPHRTL